MIQIGIKKLFPDVTLPAKQTAGSAGLDIEAYCPGDVVINPGQCILVPTGMIFEIPDGYDIEIRPRSGLSTKNLLLLPNSPGTVDADYRGEVKVALFNLSPLAFTVTHKMRIAQLILRKNLEFSWQEKNELDKSHGRGEGGFGSTGF